MCFRVSELVFPPIPQPPPKYICFLEKNDTHSVSTLTHLTLFTSHPATNTQNERCQTFASCVFQFFHQAQTVYAEEEITEVECEEENTGMKLWWLNEEDKFEWVCVMDFINIQLSRLYKYGAPANRHSGICLLLLLFLYTVSIYLTSPYLCSFLNFFNLWFNLCSCNLTHC